MTGVSCPIFKSKIKKSTLLGKVCTGKVGCTDLLSFPASNISFIKNYPLQQFSLWFTGYDTFGQEKEIQEHLKSMEFEYECGNLSKFKWKESVFWKSSQCVWCSKEICNPTEWKWLFGWKEQHPKKFAVVLLTGDKGGNSTKLLLQFLNCKEQHSIHTARLLATYEGNKDNYRCMQKVFGPVIKETIKVLSNITELDIKVDLTIKQIPWVQVSSPILTSKGWEIGLTNFKSCSEIAKTNITAKDVRYVRKQHIFNHNPPTVMPTTHPVKSISFQSSGSVLEGTGSS